tara:strand:+ start:961 stop:1134 length:174 start_codon:yes stop_codon:yes gene_type:complete
MKEMRTESEAQALLNLLSSLPKGNTPATPDKPEQKKKWSRVNSYVKNNGRVNKTKGK